MPRATLSVIQQNYDHIVCYKTCQAVVFIVLFGFEMIYFHQTFIITIISNVFLFNKKYYNLQNISLIETFTSKVIPNKVIITFNIFLPNNF